MIALHGGWRKPPTGDGKFFLWAETTTPASPPRRKKTPQKPEGREPKSHPYQSSSKELTDALNNLAFKPGLMDKVEKSSLQLFLPTVAENPCASSPLINDTYIADEDNEPSLAPWTISVLEFHISDAVPLLVLLSDSPPNTSTGKGTLLGLDLRFWSEAAKFTLELLARQRFIPHMEAMGEGKNKQYRAVWRPLLNDAHDSERAFLLTESLPPICRAVAGCENDPSHLVKSFLSEAVDSLVRRWASEKPSLNPGNEDTVEARWFKCLTSPTSPVVKGDYSRIERLQKTLESWTAEIYYSGEHAFRTCFRLEPPTLEDESHPPKNLDGWVLRYLLQATDDPSLLVPAEAVWKETGPTLKYLTRRFDNPQERLLADLGKASRLFPKMERSMRSPTPSHCLLNVDEAYAFLKDYAWLLKESGFSVQVPPWWGEKGGRVEVQLMTKPPAKAQGSDLFTIQSLCDFDWRVAVGDTLLSEEEFQQIATLKAPLIYMRGRWVELREGETDAILRQIDAYRRNGGIPLGEALQLSVASPDEGIALRVVDSEGWVKEMMQQVTGKREALPEIPTPPGFVGVLRPYQVKGFSWLTFLNRWGLGACLADDMGLGKTIQFIALLLQILASGSRKPTLLVCPTSLVGNWVYEVKRFAPSVKLMTHHGSERLTGEDLALEASKHHLVISTYALIHRDIDSLSAIEWDTVVLDEAQNIKNHWTMQARAVRRLETEHRVALAGTPIENRLSELWSIMDFLNPGYLGTLERFREQFAIPIERYRDRMRRERLQRLVQPFILRRLKTDPRIISDLPEKMEMKVYCSLSEEQASIYEAFVKDLLSEIEASEGIQRKGRILSALTRLKQVCDHPALFTADNGRLEGRSGKMERLKEMLEEVVDGGDKALVFTQYAKMGEMLRTYIQSNLGCEVLFLHGGIPRKRRDMMVSRFQRDTDGAPVFVLSLKAGGLGLNLTRANNVFHYDRWWNPAVENQATDRVFRIGQTKNVQVHKMVSVGTLEEKIDEMIERKKELAENILGTGEAWLTELDTEELRSIFTLRRESVGTLGVHDVELV